MELTQEFVKTIEIEYLRCVSELLKSGAMDLPTAKASAKEFLTYVPFSSVDDMRGKIQKFISTYPALNIFHVRFLTHVEDEHTKGVLEQMRHHLKNNDIDAALQLVQK